MSAYIAAPYHDSWFPADSCHSWLKLSKVGSVCTVLINILRLRVKGHPAMAHWQRPAMHSDQVDQQPKGDTAGNQHDDPLRRMRRFASSGRSLATPIISLHPQQGGRNPHGLPNVHASTPDHTPTAATVPMFPAVTLRPQDASWQMQGGSRFIPAAFASSAERLGRQSPLKRGHAMLTHVDTQPGLTVPRMLAGSGGSLPAFSRLPVSLSSDSSNDTSHLSPIQVSCTSFFKNPCNHTPGDSGECLPVFCLLQCC